MERHDGTGATCDDFRNAMAEANDANLDQFALWYSTAGTPQVSYKYTYDKQSKNLSITLTQHLECDPSVLLHIPVAVGILDRETGKEVVPTTTLDLKQKTQIFEFSGLQNDVVVSLLRDFSAPVILLADDRRQHDDSLSFLATYDTDFFNRWESIQQLFALGIFSIMEKRDSDDTQKQLFQAFGHTLRDANIDASSKSYLLNLPTESILSRQLKVDDPNGVHAARQEMGRRISLIFASEIRSLYDKLTDLLLSGEVNTDTNSRSKRALRNVLLEYLCFVDIHETDRVEVGSLAMAHLDDALCLTDKLAAFRQLSSMTGEVSVYREEATEKFYKYAKGNDQVVMHKWFQTQALSHLPEVLDRVKNLTRHPDFEATNAGRFRSLITAFTMNAKAFHCQEGYSFIADVIIQIDRIAPQLAIELAGKLTPWRRHHPVRSQMMRSELSRILSNKHISTSLAKTIHRAL